MKLLILREIVLVRCRLESEENCANWQDVLFKHGSLCDPFELKIGNCSACVNQGVHYLNMNI